MKIVDLTGKVFGSLTVVSRCENKGHYKAWMCICECGNTTEQRGTSLTRGDVVSCGCHRAKQSAIRNRIHGHYYKVSYKHWKHMMDRCYNENNGSYKRYGGRGIKVCEHWHEFLNFEADMKEPTEGMTLERKDYNGDYSPDNCKWASMREQANNRSSNYWIEHDGIKKSLSDWARLYDMKPATLQMRLEKGLSFTEATTKPVRITRRNLWIEYEGERRTLTHWAGRFDLGVTTLASRLKNGWSVSDALNAPVQVHEGVNA